MAIPGDGDVGKGCARQNIKKWFPDLILKDAVSEADIKVNNMKKMDNGHFVNGIAKRGLGLGLGLDPGVKVHVSPKHLDEKVAAVLGKLGAKLDISVRATDVPGDGDVGKGCAAVTNQAGFYNMATMSDPNSASQANMKEVKELFDVFDLTRDGMVTVSDLARVLEALGEAFPVTRNKHIIMANHMKKMKDNGHFVDGIDMRGLGLELDPGVKVHVWPKHLDEKVAAVPLGKLGAKLTKLSKEQAHYISVLAA